MMDTLREFFCTNGSVKASEFKNEEGELQYSVVLETSYGDKTWIYDTWEDAHTAFYACVTKCGELERHLREKYAHELETDPLDRNDD